MTGEHGRLEALLDVSAHELSLVVVRNVLGCHADEACAAHCRVADGVLGSRLHQVNHHLDDVARRAELTVLSAGGELGEKVLVDVTHDVIVGEVNLLELVYDSGERTRVTHYENGVLHVLSEGGVLA